MSLNCVILRSTGSTTIHETFVVFVRDKNNINGNEVDFDNLKIGNIKYLIFHEKNINIDDYNKLKLWKIPLDYNLIDISEELINKPDELVPIQLFSHYFPDENAINTNLIIVKVPDEQPVREYLGRKRKKTDDDDDDDDKHDDMSLQKVWQAFKEATLDANILNMSVDVSYLLERDDYENPMTTIFIRNCYLDLYKTIFDSNKSRWHVSGNPGIGKTFFGFYLLDRIAQVDGTVIYHPSYRAPILFSRTKVYSKTDINMFRNYLAKNSVYYIVDAVEPVRYCAKTILLCSQKKYYKTYDSPGISVRYMPVWSLAEINFCKDKINIFEARVYD